MNFQRLSSEALGLSEVAARTAGEYFAESIRLASEPDPALVEHRRQLFAACITSELHVRSGVDAGRTSDLFTALVERDGFKQTVEVVERQGRALLFTNLTTFRVRGSRGRQPMAAGHLLPLADIVELFREFCLIKQSLPGEEVPALACVRARIPELNGRDAQRLSEMLRSLAQVVIAGYREGRSQVHASRALLDPDECVEVAERAAIQEFDGGLSRYEAERAALASRVRRPH